MATYKKTTVLPQRNSQMILGKQLEKTRCIWLSRYNWQDLEETLEDIHEN